MKQKSWTGAVVFCVICYKGVKVMFLIPASCYKVLLPPISSYNSQH